MIVLKARWRITVLFRDVTIHMFTTDTECLLSEALKVTGAVIETDQVPTQRRKYEIRIEVVDVP